MTPQHIANDAVYAAVLGYIIFRVGTLERAMHALLDHYGLPKPKRGVLKALTRTAGLAGAILGVHYLTGCAAVSQSARIERQTTNGPENIVLRGNVYSLFQGTASVDKLRVSAAKTSTSLGLSGADTETSSTSNTVEGLRIMERILRP